MRRLYVISSLHHVNNARINRRLRSEELLSIRLATIAEVAGACGEGVFFSDGTGPALSCEYNRLLRTMPPERIVGGALAAHAEGDYKAYDYLRTILIFKALRAKGVHFQFRPTEKYDSEELREAYAQEALQGEDERKIRSMGQRQLYSYLLERSVPLRDRDIVQNIRRYAWTENILFVGRSHQLAHLPESGLESYRVEIEQGNDAFVIRGNLPRKFEHGMQRLRSLEQKVDVQISYQ